MFGPDCNSLFLICYIIFFSEWVEVKISKRHAPVEYRRLIMFNSFVCLCCVVLAYQLYISYVMGTVDLNLYHICVMLFLFIIILVKNLTLHKQNVCCAIKLFFNIEIFCFDVFLVREISICLYM